MLLSKKYNEETLNLIGIAHLLNEGGNNLSTIDGGASTFTYPTIFYKGTTKYS
jgi:hypothetical protein